MRGANKVLWLLLLALLGYGLTGQNAPAANRYVVQPGQAVSMAPYLTWATAATNITDALIYAVDGDVVWVTNGTYYLSDAILISAGYTLKSANGYADTILNANNYPGKSVTNRVLKITHPNAVVDGFTVRNGIATNHWASDQTRYLGGGAYLQGGTIQNCLIRDNRAGHGGGVYLARNSTSVLFNCVVSNNVATNLAAGNYGWAGGAYVSFSNRVERCQFLNNSSASNGGGISISNAVIYSSLLVANSAGGEGGGIYCAENTHIQNCTVARNIAASTSGGGGVSLLNRMPESWVENTIIYSNTAPSSTNADVYNNVLRAYFTNCCLGAANDPSRSFNNLVTNPVFAGVSTGNYQLAFNSPCINAGTNRSWMTNASDLVGTARIIGYSADIGAFEHPSPYLNLTLTPASQVVQVGSNMVSTNFTAQLWNSNAFATTVVYAVSSSVPWLAWNGANPTSLVWRQTNTLLYTCSSVGYGPGAYSGQVTLVAATNLNPLLTRYQNISNTLAVVMNVMNMTMTATSIVESVMVGLPLPSRDFTLHGIGAGAMSYAVTTDADWLSVTPASGVLSNSDIHTLTIQYDTSLMSPGLSNATLQVVSIDGCGYTNTIPVSVGVMNLAVSPTTASNTVLSGFNVSNLAFTVANSGSGVMQYTMESNVSWLSASPSSGASTNGATNAHILGYGTASLALGSHSGQVNIISTDGGGATSGVSALVTVLPSPVLSLNTNQLSSLVAKGENPPNTNVSIWNGSPALNGLRVPMTWALSKDVTWLGLSVVGGVSTGDAASVGIVFNDMTAYAAGTYTGRITATAVDSGAGYQPLGGARLTNVLVVTVQISAPTRPSGVFASQGTDVTKVTLTWSPATAVGGVSGYEVWRGTTFETAFAVLLAQVSDTRYEDYSVASGAPYYYWIRAMNNAHAAGEYSDYAQGFRRLSAPGGVFASDGLYTDKIRITWSAADNASSYRVYRSVANGEVSLLKTVSGTTCDDNQISDGVQYLYQISAINALGSSELSVGDIGYVMSRATGLAASQGAYVGRIHLTWNAATAATRYEIWRSTVSSVATAVKLAESTAVTYDDTVVTSGTLYYYWIKAKNSSATAGVSDGAQGFAASASVDLAVWDFVVLPANARVGNAPAVTSLRLGNFGGASLVAPHTALGLNVYASSTTSLSQGVWIGGVGLNVTLAPGSSTVLYLTPSLMTLPTTPGDYYLFATVLPVYPSTLTDSNPANNTVMRLGVLHVTAHGLVTYQNFNDYDGDGMSDLAIYSPQAAQWYIRSRDGQVLAWAKAWGVSGQTPALGDFDGNLAGDLVTVGNGAWYALDFKHNVVNVWNESWGLAGMTPMPGNYGGTASSDLAVYDGATGNWYIREKLGGILAWALNWGGPGFTPVPGDYDGDGLWDLAVYHALSGAWYVRAMSGRLMTWGESWGGPTFVAVPGDYDGDGTWDFAVCDATSGLWYIRSFSGTQLAWGTVWGGPGLNPVSGDFNGDGKYDLAVYSPAAGAWYIRDLAGTTLVWDIVWGADGFLPVSIRR